MPGIICAIRGGPASQPTIQTAIQLGRETGLPLYFLYIINLDFLVHTTSSRTALISKELEAMGEFILLKARSEAEARQVAASGIIRKGNVLEEILQLCEEMNADYIVLGRPKGQSEENVFTDERLNAFARKAEANGARIVLATADSTHEDSSNA